VSFELRADTARDIISVNAPGFMDYYSARIERIMKDNLQVTIKQRDNGLGCAHSMNNECESANHQLKMVVDWKSKSLTQLIDALRKEVQSPYPSVERAFIDRGVSPGARVCTLQSECPCLCREDRLAEGQTYGKIPSRGEANSSQGCDIRRWSFDCSNSKKWRQETGAN